MRARGAVIGDDVVTIDRERCPALGIDDSADDADQRRLACAIGTEQRKNLSAANVQVDALERFEAGGVGLREIRY